MRRLCQVKETSCVIITYFRYHHRSCFDRSWCRQTVPQPQCLSCSLTMPIIHSAVSMSQYQVMWQQKLVKTVPCITFPMYSSAASSRLPFLASWRGGCDFRNGPSAWCPNFSLTRESMSFHCHLLHRGLSLSHFHDDSRHKKGVGGDIRLGCSSYQEDSPYR